MEHNTHIAEAFDDWAELLATWVQVAHSEDIAFYRQLVQQCDRPAVELGIGDGRVAAHTAPDYGIDFSPVMLQRCHERLPDGPQLLRADLETYRLPEPAAFSYAPLNTFNHVISPTSRAAIFRNIWHNTQPGGYLAFDSVVRNGTRLRERNNIPVFRGRIESIAIFDITSVLSFETWESLIQVYVDQIDEQGSAIGRKYYQPMPFCFVAVEDYRRLAQATGWQIRQLWGGFGREPLTEDSRVQIWLLQKPADQPEL